jgi:hypothetical protein
VTVKEVTVQTFVVVEATVGVSPEVAVGATVNVDADHKLSESDAKVTVFEA